MRPVNSAGHFSAMEIAASGLTAERSRMNIVASNLANARTTKTAAGTPYKRIDAVFQAVPLATRSADPVLRQARLVRMTGVREDTQPGQKIYEPGHPDADKNGYVEYPNVNVVTEMVNLMTASRAYEAGITSVEAAKSMARSALKLGQ